MIGPGSVLIIGVGRPGLGDDALGLAAAGALSERRLGAVRVVADGTGLALLTAPCEEDLLVVIDAAQADAGLPAGEWCRIRYPQDADALDNGRLRSTHTFSVSEALSMAAALGSLPRQVWIYTLAGERFAPEHGLSPAVAAALQRMTEEINARVREWLALR